METFDINTPIMELTNKAGTSWWTAANAFEGVQIFGGIGSGKTSGSGRMLALKYLSAGFGGLVLTVKPDEREQWEKYCALTGRGDDLVVVSPGREHHFNFLDYVSQNGGLTENIVEVLKTVIHAGQNKASGVSDDPFWETALDMLIFNVIDLCQLAYGSVSVQSMYDIVQTLPKSDAVSDPAKPTAFTKAFAAADEKVTAKAEAWKLKQSIADLAQYKQDPTAYAEALYEHVPGARLLSQIQQFFGDTYASLNEKTRSIIDFTFTGFLFRLLRDPVYSLFCKNGITFKPEDCWQGKIIVLDLPVKLYQKVGRDMQIMFKYLWQVAMEKRDIKENGRPVFLWADEAQNFLHEHDPDYQATARSSRIATVYISQNLPNYHANMGGAKADFKVKSFLGTLATKIFHANADVETNRYASELIGDGYFEDTSKTATAAGQFSASQTTTIKIERLVRPEEFIRLKTGSGKNQGKITGYLHVQGNTLHSGLNHIKVEFDYNYKPLNPPS